MKAILTRLSREGSLDTSLKFFHFFKGLDEENRLLALKVYKKIAEEKSMAGLFDLRLLTYCFDEEEFHSVLLRLEPFHSHLDDLDSIFKVLSHEEKKQVVQAYVAPCYEEDKISADLDEIRKLEKNEPLEFGGFRNHLLQVIRTIDPKHNQELVKALPLLIQTRNELIAYLNILIEDSKQPLKDSILHLKDDFYRAIKDQPLNIKKQLSYIYLRVLVQEVKEQLNSGKHDEKINQLCDSLEKRCKNWAKKEVSDSVHLELKELERDCQAEMATMHLYLRDNKGIATLFCEWFMVLATLGGVLLASSLYHGYKTGNYRPRFFDVAGEETLREVGSFLDLKI